jgi:hypothetical protein
MADLKAREVVCILDILDKCTESGWYQIVDAVKAFYNQASSRESSSQLKLLITSRPYLDIK